MTESRKANLPRLLSLFIAFVGCVVAIVPILNPAYLGTNPTTVILIGSGLTVVSLGLFLFFSI
jgi:hypothetical protein